MDSYVAHGKWQEAFALVARYPELKESVYLPYANYLAERDRFDEAQDAFREAGHPDKAVKVLKVLTHNAVDEQR
jgi:intraflagellar transport protein 122